MIHSSVRKKSRTRVLKDAIQKKPRKNLLTKEKAEKKFAVALKLWRDGVSTDVIIKNLGYTRDSFYTTAAMLRKRFGLFPQRSHHKVLSGDKSECLQKYSGWQKMWSEGKSADAIAETYACSTAWVFVVIRKLRKAYGWFPERHLVRAKPSIQDDELKYAHLRKLWDLNSSFDAMAAAFQITISGIKQTIRRLRKKHGWFPSRPRPQRTGVSRPHVMPLSEDAAKTRYSHLIEMWNNGDSKGRIAKTIQKSSGTVNNIIRTYPNLFDISRRESSLKAKFATEYNVLLRMWSEGASAADMAKATKRTLVNTKGIVVRFRKRFGWFDKYTKENRREFTKKKYAEWLKLWEEGYTPSQLAKAFSLKKETVDCILYRYRRLYNWFTIRRKQRLPAIGVPPEQHYAQYIELWNRGYTMRAITREMGFRDISITRGIIKYARERYCLRRSDQPAVSWHPY